KLVKLPADISNETLGCGAKGELTHLCLCGSCRYGIAGGITSAAISVPNINACYQLQAAMLHAIRNSFRLTKAGLTLAWCGIGFVRESMALPGPLGALRGAGGGEEAAAKRKGERLSRTVRALGPSYIKLGQFLSTRPDVVGPQLADALGALLDRLPPF